MQVKRISNEPLALGPWSIQRIGQRRGGQPGFAGYARQIGTALTQCGDDVGGVPVFGGIYSSLIL